MEERREYLLGYYRDELGCLLNYLEDKEPLSDEDIKESRDWFIEIYNQMREYRDSSNDKVFTKILSRSLDILPGPLTIPAEWHGKLYQAMRTLT